MAKEILNNGETGLQARTKINNNFTELYDDKLTSVEKIDLTDSGDSTLHYHAADRNRANHTGTQTASTISDFDTEVSNNTDVAANTTHISSDGKNHSDVVLNNAYRLVGHVPLAEKGANSGVATLDSGGKVPSSQLPNSIMDYKGTWNASTNTPTLEDGTGNSGDVYIVSVGGTQDLGSGSIVFSISDWIIYNGSVWEKSINSNSVVSVNTYTGVITLDSDDISEGATNLYLTGNEFQKTTDTMDNITNGVTYVKTTNDYTTSEKNKLNQIEALADVTDATNVDAAGAVMESDASTANMNFVIDEDNMSSNLATKVPTQQSVKAYVDASKSNSLVVKTTNYTVVDTDDFILVDATAGDVTIELLASASRTNNRPLHIKKIDSSTNSMILDGNLSETIDGATSLSTNIQYDSISIVPQGGNWFIY